MNDREFRHDGRMPAVVAQQIPAHCTALAVHGIEFCSC